MLSSLVRPPFFRAAHQRPGRPPAIIHFNTNRKKYQAFLEPFLHFFAVLSIFFVLCGKTAGFCKSAVPKNRPGNFPLFLLFRRTLSRRRRKKRIARGEDRRLTPLCKGPPDLPFQAQIRREASKDHIRLKNAFPPERSASSSAHSPFFLITPNEHSFAASNTSSASYPINRSDIVSSSAFASGVK